MSSNGYVDNDNATNTVSSSDYFTVPSQAQTYQHHPTNNTKNNGNPFVNPPSSAHPHHISQGFHHYNNTDYLNHHRSYSHQNHKSSRDKKHHKSNKHRSKTKKTSKTHKKKYTYNVNDILEMAGNVASSYDDHKYKDYNRNQHHQYID